MLITLDNLISKLSDNLGNIAIKVYRPNEKGEVSRQDDAIHYGILSTEPYIHTFNYTYLKGEKIDLKRILASSVLEIDIAEDIGNYKEFNEALIMISLKLTD